MNAEPVLEVDDLTVVSPDGQAVVDRVALRLFPGEIVGLTGPSGSGKSTLALAVLGLARRPLAVRGGRVMLDGADLLALPAQEVVRRRGREIALIVQNPRAALHPMLSVGQQVGRVWRYHHGGSKIKSRRLAVEMLELVGINDAKRRAGAFAHELSGGMAQRALIAAALAAGPRVLIADEPTSGLDVTVQAAFLDMMASAAKAKGMAMLLVTQEPGILANYCSRVLTMESGRIASEQPVEQYFSGYRDTTTLIPPPIVADRVVIVSNLTKTFPLRGTKARVHAVDGVSLSIARGETLGLVGESGSGKSTVGRSIIRLIEPDSGNIEICAQSVSSLTALQLRRLRGRIQLVQQDPFDSFDPRWIIARSVEEPLRREGQLTDTDRAARVSEVLDLVGCGEFAARLPGDLSAGTLQRAAIARALATRPHFVVLDEPTSVLTPDARRELIALLGELQKQIKCSFLLISHDLTTVATISHRVAVMYLGQLVEVGDTRQIFEQPRHPYTRALIAAHLSVDLARRRIDSPPADRIEGEIPSPIELPPGCYFASRCPFVVDRCRNERQTLEATSVSTVRCWRADSLPLFERPPLEQRL